MILDHNATQDQLWGGGGGSSMFPNYNVTQEFHVSKVQCHARSSNTLTGHNANQCIRH